MKKWKKSPKQYEVFDDNGFVITQGNKRHDYNNHKGNLAELYQNLHTLKENTYTDNHTKTKIIKIIGNNFCLILLCIIFTSRRLNNYWMSMNRRKMKNYHPLHLFLFS